MIAAVLFDMGGTLLDYERATWEETMAAAYLGVHRELVAVGYGGEAGAFQRLLAEFEDRLWQVATDGRDKPTLAGEIAALLGQLDIEPDPDLVGRCVRAYAHGLQTGCGAYPDSEPALAYLRERGLKIGLISNTIVPGEAHVEDLARFGLLEYFDDMIFSADVGLWKPQPEVFQLALSRLGLQPEDSIFVGDQPWYDVGGAQGVGMRGLLLERPRAEQPDSRGVTPDWRMPDLSGLPALIRSLS